MKLLLATLMMFATVPVGVEPLGRVCKDTGNTRYVVRVHNNTDHDIQPNIWYSYTDTGFVSATKDIPAGESRKMWAVIPPGREISYLAIYEDYFSKTVLFEKRNIKALEC